MCVIEELWRFMRLPARPIKDLKRDGPRILVSATDLADGTRLIFNPDNFDVLCTDLSSIRLARAAAASSAVPVVLSSITIDNYGGTCGYRPPPWAKLFLDNPEPPRPAARTVKRLQELEAFADREHRPFLHLVDGGVSDNVGMRGVLDVLSTFESLHAAGQKTPYDHVRNIFIFVVNSLATPPNDWGRHENPPALFDVLIKATGTPIDRYSYDTVETLRDIQARWASMREVRDAIKPYPALGDRLQTVMRAPDITIRVVEVSFGVLPDKGSATTSTPFPRRSFWTMTQWTVCAWRQRTRSSPLPRSSGSSITMRYEWSAQGRASARLPPSCRSLRISAAARIATPDQTVATTRRRTTLSRRRRATVA